MGSLGTTWKKKEAGFLLSLMENINMIYQENITDIAQCQTLDKISYFYSYGRDEECVDLIWSSDCSQRNVEQMDSNQSRMRYLLTCTGA